MVGLFIHREEVPLKHTSLFLIAAISLALMAWAPLGDSTSLAPVEVRNAILQNATVRIEPVESVVGVGETFTVSVMIDQADDLGGFEFTLLFVPTTVTVDSVTVGDLPGSTGREDISIGPTSDNQAGRVSFGAVTVPPDVPGASGTGVLATVTLTAQGFGESPLDLQDVMVLNTHAELETSLVEDGVVRAGFVVYLPLVMKEW